MATKLYFHDATSPDTGTLPTTTPGSAVEIMTGAEATATTNRDATDTIGALQTSSLITANANQNKQAWGHRRFLSRPLAAQTFAAADGNWTWSYARSENNLNHNMSLRMYIQLWTPGTGSVVITSNPFTGSEPTSASTEQTESLSTIPFPATGSQACSDGDILVFEIYSVFTQGKSSALTDSFYYDGTTEASTTSCATFISSPRTITFQVPSAPTSIAAVVMAPYTPA